jgi:hypothetical protein
VTETAQTDLAFEFRGIPEIEEPEAIQALAQPPDPLGPLAKLIVGDGPTAWAGTGFNAIWRPHPLASGGQDRFLELNLTSEKLVFRKIKGKIPNRGLLMPDINMVGLTYLQEISEKEDGTGLHIEPGIWLSVPHTTNPAEPPTVVRMASIPHGTTILAQGVGKSVAGGPRIGDNNIIPFPVGSAPPQNSDFAAAEAVFTELNLATPTQFRHAAPGVTEEMVRNPNSVLQQAIAGQHIKGTTVLAISTTHSPVKGGGTANTAFLEAATFPPGGNAKAVEVSAIFWIESVAGAEGEADRLQLQYTQLVQLDFNGLRWPHVTVATLHKT